MKQSGDHVWEKADDLPERVDPYRHWFGRQDYLQKWSELGSVVLPFLVTAPDADQLRARVEKLDDRAKLFIPEFYRKLYFDNGPCLRPKGPFQLVGLAEGFDGSDLDISDLDGVIASGMPIPTEREEPDDQMTQKTSRGRHPRSASLSEFFTHKKKTKRLVAIIDSDIAFANERFRTPSGDSRIAWFWDMNANAYSFGRMMAKPQINGYLSMLSGGASEMKLYQKYTRDSFLRPWDALPPSVFGHGTGVLDAAVGGEVLNGCEDTEIIAIQLPRYAVAQTHGQFLWLYVLMALDLISCLSLLVGLEQGTQPETLVNVSVGGHGGRHDGFSGLELAMDERINNGNLHAIFLAAGNSYGQKIHANFRGADLTNRQDLIWRLQPDDGTSSFLEIWLPKDTDGQIELTVELPDGTSTTIPETNIKAGYVQKLFINGEEAAAISIQKDPLILSAPGPKRLQVLLAVRGTALARPRFSAVPGLPQIAGDWKIGLKRGSALADDDIVTLWISRDDEILRLPTGARQSFFTAYSPAAAHIDNQGTISDMASGQATTICAGHWASDRMMTPYSGRGIPQPESVAQRDIFPTASYASDESEAHTGITVSGYFSGSALTMRGTSVASPQVMRLALTGALPSPPSSIKDRVAALANTQETLPVPDNPVKAKAQYRTTSSPEDWGAGRLDFVQKPLGASGSTNYPKRRNNSI